MGNQGQPWGASCHLGFSQLWEGKGRDPHHHHYHGQLSPWTGEGDGWIPTNSAVSPGCPGRPLFPGTPCSQEETTISGSLSPACRSPAPLLSSLPPLSLVLLSQALEATSLASLLSLEASRPFVQSTGVTPIEENAFPTGQVGLGIGEGAPSMRLAYFSLR